MLTPMGRSSVIAFLAGLLGCAAGLDADEPGAPRPNILFVIVDDQSPFDLRVYEPRTALETPVIDALAQRGMTIDGAYHMGSWSGPCARRHDTW